MAGCGATMRSIYCPLRYWDHRRIVDMPNPRKFWWDEEHGRVVTSPPNGQQYQRHKRPNLRLADPPWLGGDSLEEGAVERLVGENGMRVR